MEIKTFYLSKAKLEYVNYFSQTKY